MAGFPIGDKQYPTLWADRENLPGQAVFVYLHEQDTTPGLVTEDYMIDIANDVINGDREDFGYTELYVLMPKGTGLIRCEATAQNDGDGSGLMYIRALTSGGELIVTYDV